MRRLFVAAAEASGDRLAAELVSGLRRRGVDFEARGLAGPRMVGEGVVPVAASDEATALGLWEVLGQLPRLWGALRRLRADLVANPPDVVLTVDSPDLMLRLGAFARSRGHHVVHWVAPQIWAWRSGRVTGLARSVDEILCLLPFEPALLEPHVSAVFTGHPAAAIEPGLRVRPGTPTYALVPGSRRSEIRRLWPVLREVARSLRRRHPAAGFVVPVAPSIPRASLGGLDAVFVDRMADVAQADAAIVASGTATIELAALGVPMVVVYQVHPVTYAVARRWVRTPHLALPNVLAGRALVPELVQQLDPAAIVRAVEEVRGTEQVPRRIIDRLEGAHAVERAVDVVVARLGGQAPPSR